MVESIRDLVKGKRIVFVGNSVEIMKHKLADKINSYDIVVRFGRAIGANKLQEESLKIIENKGLLTANPFHPSTLYLRSSLFDHQVI